MNDDRARELAARLPKGSKKGCKPLKINALSIAKLMAALVQETSGLSMAELIDACGLSDGVIRGYLQAMHKEGAIYVKAWGQDTRNRHNVKLWALGVKTDATRPDPECHNQQQVRYRARRKQAQLLGIVRHPANDSSTQAAA